MTVLDHDTFGCREAEYLVRPGSITHQKGESGVLSTSFPFPIGTMEARCLCGRRDQDAGSLFGETGGYARRTCIGTDENSYLIEGLNGNRGYLFS